MSDEKRGIQKKTPKKQQQKQPKHTAFGEEEGSNLEDDASKKSPDPWPQSTVRAAQQPLTTKKQRNKEEKKE